MQGPFLRKYGVEATVDFQLWETDGASFQTGAVYAAGDVKIMKDEGAEANTTNSFTDEGTGYSIVLTATEMQAARIVFYVADQTSPAVWLDESVVVETYGNASAMHAFDLDTATQGVDVVSISGDTTAADNAELAFDGNGYGFTGCTMPTTTAVTNRVTANTDQIEGADATDTIDAQVLAQLQALNLDHLLLTACPGNVITGAVNDNTVIAAIAAIGNDISDYSTATDSLEALGAGTGISAAVADAVWDEQLSGHTAAGSAGEAQAGSRTADYVWDEVIEAAANANAQTARQILRVLAAFAAGEDAGEGDWSCKSIDGNKTRISGTLSATGARESVTTLDGS